MNLFGISSLILSLSSIGFSFLVFRNDRTNKINRAWFFTSISFSVWAAGLYGVTSTDHPHTALVWQYVLDIAAIFLPALYFNFISELVQYKNYFFRYLSLFIAFAMSIFSLTPYFKVGVAKKYEFFWIEPGPYYIIFMAYFVLHAIIAIIILLREYRKHEKGTLLHGQIRNTLLGGVMGYAGGLTNFFPQFFNIYPFGNYLVILFTVFMVYGVLRYKLLSTKVISAQIFSVALVLIFLFNLLRSEELTSWISNFVMFILVIFFSFLLVQSVNREVKTREKVEKLADDLSQANERLKELDQQKSEFVSLASHQLRGPLTAVKGYASMLLEGDFGLVEGNVKDAIDKIYKSTQDLVVLVGDYLDVSRIEQGRMQYDFTTFDMKDLVQTVVSELKPTIERAKLTLEFDCDATQIYKVNADMGKIKQVIGNFIDNAVKYTPKGGIHVWLTKTAQATESNSPATSDKTLSNKNSKGKALVTITDTGVGIAPEVLPKLFEKFTRAPDASKTNILGTGLGLYVARKMIEAHHGRVWAESAGQGKGSTFFIELDLTE